jgi:hypothetical protein
VTKRGGCFDALDLEEQRGHVVERESPQEIGPVGNSFARRAGVGEVEHGISRERNAADGKISAA